MVLEGIVDGAVSLLALVYLEVLRAHIEIVLFALREVQAVSIDRLRVFLGTSNGWLLGRRCSRVGTLFDDFEEAEVLGIKKRRRLPVAHLAVIADGDDIVLVVEADHLQAVDRVLVTVPCQAALLDWL